MSITDEKFLLFDLGNESYGIPILRVNEIIGMTEIVPIPKTPVFMKGIINLRGRIIPVLDLRVKFSMSEKDPDAQTCIIIVERTFEGKITFVGLLVDKVAEVVSILPENVSIPPQYGQTSDELLFTGVGKVKDDVVMLLNIDSVLSNQEMAAITKEKKSFEAEKEFAM